MTATRTGPSIRRGKSRQDYGTPREFLDAVERRFGTICFDLAASKSNAVCPAHFTKEDDALAQDWRGIPGTLWLNPPYADIGPWANKCAQLSWRYGWLLFLVPASVDSNWFAGAVERCAFVMPLSPRLTFVGEKDPYPKPVMLCAFGFGVSGFQPWRWKP